MCEKKLIAAEVTCGFLIRGCDDSLFQVASIKSELNHLSEDYMYNIEVKTLENIDVKKLIKKQAQLTWAFKTECVVKNGVVTTVSHIAENRYRIGLASPLYLLKLQSHNRTFVNLTPIEIIEELFRSAGFLSDQYQLCISKAFARCPLVTQYNELDYDFLQRILVEHGLLYYFKHSEKQTAIVVVDDIKLIRLAHKKISLSYQAKTGLLNSDNSIYELSQRLMLTANQSTQACCRWQDNYCVIRSNCVNLALGSCVELIGVEQGKRDRFTVVAHQCLCNRQAGAQQTDSLGYLLPEGEPYSLCIQSQQHAEVMAAVIAQNNAQPPLDMHGSYPIKMLYDGDVSPQHSHQVYLSPQLQPYAGDHHTQTSYGWHLPLRATTPVVTVGIEGKLTNPIILGACASINHHSSVNNNTCSEHVWRTHTENSVILGDANNKQKILLASKDDENKIFLNASHENPTLELTSKLGNISSQAKQSLYLVSKDDMLLVAENNSSWTSQMNKYLLSEQGGLQLFANELLNLKAGNNLQFESRAQGCHLDCGGAYRHQNVKEFAWQVSGGNLQLTSVTNNIQLSVEKTLSITAGGEGNIRLNNKSASVSLTPYSILEINTRQFIVNAAQINLV